MKVKYYYDEHGCIITGNRAPFDGEPVLIKLASGWCEAWWAEAEYTETVDGPEASGFCWVCLDDHFEAELDEALEWLPLPESEDGCAAKLRNKLAEVMPIVTAAIQLNEADESDGATKTEEWDDYWDNLKDAIANYKRRTSEPKRT